MAVQTIDELKIYRGQDYDINDQIHIHVPTLGEICDYGENSYFALVHTMTATPSDMMWQLNDMGTDFTTIDNFTLFSQLMCFKLPGSEEKDFTLNKEKTSILLGDLDLFQFDNMVNMKNNEPCLYNKQTGVTIDSYTYKLIADTIRKIHFIEENIVKPANESTKQVLIEDAKEAYMLNKDKTPTSYLLNLVSAMINSSGFKYNHNEVWSMKINAFLDSVRRISKIQNANLLLQSGYSGFGINLKEIKDKKQLDWLGELS